MYSEYGINMNAPLSTEFVSEVFGCNLIGINGKQSTQIREQQIQSLNRQTKEETSVQISSSFDILKEKGRGEKQMSFIAIAKNKNGMVAVGDSKSSTMFEGSWTEGHCMEQKVFYASEFLLAVADTNEYLRNDKQWDLGELIQRRIEGFHGTHREFTDFLLQDIMPTYKWNPKLKTVFLYGWKEREEEKTFYGMEQCTLDQQGATYNALSYTTGIMWYGGNSFLPNKINVHESWDIETLKAFCVDITKTQIELGNKYLPYNMVGGEIQIKTLV